MRGALAAGFVVLLLVGGWIWYRNTKSETHAKLKAQDAEFCAKNLDYYNNYCASWPDHCKEGPRKLARCD